MDQTPPELFITSHALELVQAINGKLWTVPIDDIILIGEYTTSEGPHRDDYFVIFVFMESGTARFAETSFYYKGVQDSFRVLSERFGEPVEFGLCNSTQWKSRIVWPVSLAGLEYFTFSPVVSSSRVGRMWARLWDQQEYRISQRVLDYIHERTASSLATPNLSQDSHESLE